MSDWQPIETAPKDGTQILAEISEGIFDVIHYSDGWREGGNMMRLARRFLRWKPIEESEE